MKAMEIQEIIQALEDSKKTLDQLTIQLAKASKERNTRELEYNKKIQVSPWAAVWALPPVLHADRSFSPLKTLRLGTTPARR